MVIPLPKRSLIKVSMGYLAKIPMAQLFLGAKPDAVTWAKVKADMDKQDAFADQKVINETARAYLHPLTGMVVEAREGGTAVPSDVATKRAAERAKVVDYADFSA